MDIVIKASQLILSLAILVFIHELGHYSFARLTGTRVDRFFIFFDFGYALLKKKIGKTVYGIGWFPLGGYCKIAGMIDESMDNKQLSSEPKEWEYRSKKTWQRLLMIIGGVLFNLILAFIIFIGIKMTWGDTKLPNKDIQYGITASPLAQEIGFRNGDKIIAVNGDSVEFFSEIYPTILLGETPIKIEIERENASKTLQITQEQLGRIINTKDNLFSLRLPNINFKIDSVPRGTPAYEAGLKRGDSVLSFDSLVFHFIDERTEYLSSKKNQLTTITFIRNGKIMNTDITIGKNGLKGVFLAPTDWSKVLPYKKIRYSFWGAIPVGVNATIDGIGNYIKQFKLIFSPETKAYKSVGSFIAIGNLYAPSWDWQWFWSITAFLSIMLAVLNILPLPALDGGHLVFIIYEMITGKKPAESVLMGVQKIGVLLLLSLMLFAFYNDIINYVV